MKLFLLLSFLATTTSTTTSDAWTSWDLEQTCSPSTFINATDVSELASALSSKKFSSVKTVGAGHSFSSIALTNEEADDAGSSLLISLAGISGIIAISDVNADSR